jgi:hypothetical protein
MTTMKGMSDKVKVEQSVPERSLWDVYPFAQGSSTMIHLPVGSARPTK